MAKQYKDDELLEQIIAGIKAIRKTNKVTLEIFYFDTGIHLARIEQRKTNLSISTLSKICEYFNISIKDFFIFIDSKLD